MKKYTATYTQDIITKPQQLQPKGCSCIQFKNLGSTVATIDGIISLEQGETQTYNEEPYVQIESDFSITFANTSDCRLLVIKSIYKEREV